MPPKSQNTVHILEGKATLYLRPTTPIWFVRYKANGKWLRTTTKQADLNDAKQAAVDIVTNAWFRVKNDLPLANKRFKHGGKGVKIMDIPDKASLIRVELCDGTSTNIIVRGKPKTIDGESLTKHLQKRAKKGLLVNAVNNSQPRQRKLL